MGLKCSPKGEIFMNKKRTETYNDTLLNSDSDISNRELLKAILYNQNKDDEHFRRIDTRLNGINTRFNTTDTKFNNIDTRFNDMDTRFNNVDKSLQKILGN